MVKDSKPKGTADVVVWNIYAVTFYLSYKRVTVKSFGS